MSNDLDEYEQRVENILQDLMKDPIIREIVLDYSPHSIDQFMEIARITRKQIWGIFPGLYNYYYGFLIPKIQRHPTYCNVTNRSTSRLLDVGSNLGIDIRKCIVDGFNPSNLAANEIFQDIFECSYSLFGHLETAEFRFFSDDLGNAKFSEINPLLGNFDYIYCANMLQLFDDSQLECLLSNFQNLVNEGGTIFGRTAVSNERFTKEYQIDGFEHVEYPNYFRTEEDYLSIFGSKDFETDLWDVQPGKTETKVLQVEFAFRLI